MPKVDRFKFKVKLATMDHRPHHSERLGAEAL
jgi:hypothetical protein